MDPLSVLSLVETCAGLTVTAGKLAVGLRTLAENYKLAAVTFRSLSSQCRLFACAVRAIQQWLEDSPDKNTLDDSILDQLIDSLECANDTIYALESELVRTSNGSVNNFWEKLNVIWNQQMLKNLEDCIHKQISSLSVILQIMNLPSKQGQKDELAERSSVFAESRLSARSIRDPTSSTIRGNEAASTMEASSITTRLSKLPGFDFDEILMTSQVYLRNRNRTLALHSASQHTHGSPMNIISASQRPIPTNESEIDRIELSQSNYINREILIRRYNSVVDSYNLLRRAFKSLTNEFNGTKDDRNNLWDAHQQLQYENRDLKHQIQQQERHDASQKVSQNQFKGQISSTVQGPKARPPSRKPASIKIPSTQPPTAGSGTFPRPAELLMRSEIVGTKSSSTVSDGKYDDDPPPDFARDKRDSAALPTPPTSASLKNMDLVNFLQDSASPDRISFARKEIETQPNGLSRQFSLSAIEHRDHRGLEDPRMARAIPSSNDWVTKDFLQDVKISDAGSDFQWPWNTQDT